MSHEASVFCGVGFEEFYGSVDVVAIGRMTFEVVFTFGKWFYGRSP